MMPLSSCGNVSEMEPIASMYLLLLLCVVVVGLSLVDRRIADRTCEVGRDI
jgi:hypothetical protein